MDISEIQAQVAEWSRRNFPANTEEQPLAGIAEEIGELARNVYSPYNPSCSVLRTATEAQIHLSEALHAILKQDQGIRGTQFEHLRNARASLDSLVGQIDILRGRMGLNSVEPTPWKPEEFREFEAYQDEVFDAVGDIMIYLADFCGRAGVDMQNAFEQTWEKVRQRDWQKNKHNGIETNVQQEVFA